MPYAVALSMILGSAICTGLGSVLGKSILRCLDPFVLGVFRSLFGLVVSLCIFIGTGESRMITGLPLSYVALALVDGVFFFLGTAFFLKAVQMANLSLVSPLVNSYPFLALGLSMVFLQEQVTLVLVLGSLMVLTGITLLGLPSHPSLQTKGFPKLSVLGLSLASAFSTAIVSVIAKFVLQCVPGATLNLAQMFITLAGFCALVVRNRQSIRVDVRTLGMICVMSLLTYVGANLAYYYALRSVPLVVAAPLSATTMLFSSLFGVVFFKETVRGKHLAGIGFTFAGVVGISASLTG